MLGKWEYFLKSFRGRESCQVLDARSLKQCYCCVGWGSRSLFLFWRNPNGVLLSGEVGNAAKMMLIVNMVQGSFMATIAEGLTLAQVTGQSQQTLLDILNQGQLASIFLDQKCQSKVLLHCFLTGHFFTI